VERRATVNQFHVVTREVQQEETEETENENKKPLFSQFSPA